MDAFTRLGMPRRLILREDELAEVIREASRKAHPDAGGDDQEFRRVREAGEALKEPLSRLRLAIGLAGGEVNARGAVDNEVMDFFSAVAGVLEKVNALIAARVAAKSQLGKAMVDAQVPALKKEVEELIHKLEEIEESIIGRFEQFDAVGWEASLGEMEASCRSLSFVVKWQGQLRGATGRLFEVLLGG
ncbi:MAG: hypothetical protein ACON38_06380 [Akkermansiaceae bacterium]